MDYRAKRFTSAVLVSASGVPHSAFHNWRKNNGLFPETVGSGGWNKFSVSDICLVGAIKVLTQEHSIGAQIAVSVADPKSEVRKDVELLLAGKERYRYIGIHSLDEPFPTFLHLDGSEKLPHIMRWSKGKITIIDLHAVVSRVVQAIEGLNKIAEDKPRGQRS